MFKEEKNEGMKNIEGKGVDVMYTKSLSHDVINIMYYGHNENIHPQLQQTFTYGVDYSEEEIFRLAKDDAKRKGLVFTPSTNVDHLYKDKPQSMYEVDLSDYEGFNKENMKKRYEELFSKTLDEYTNAKEMIILQGEMNRIINIYPVILDEITQEILNPTMKNQMRKIMEVLEEMESSESESDKKATLSKDFSNISILYREFEIRVPLDSEQYQTLLKRMETGSGSHYEVASITEEELKELFSKEEVKYVKEEYKRLKDNPDNDYWENESVKIMEEKYVFLTTNVFEEVQKETKELKSINKNVEIEYYIEEVNHEEDREIGYINLVLNPQDNDLDIEVINIEENNAVFEILVKIMRNEELLSGKDRDYKSTIGFEIKEIETLLSGDIENFYLMVEKRIGENKKLKLSGNLAISLKTGELFILKGLSSDSKTDINIAKEFIKKYRPNLEKFVIEYKDENKLTEEEKANVITKEESAKLDKHVNPMDFSRI